MAITAWYHFDTTLEIRQERIGFAPTNYLAPPIRDLSFTGDARLAAGRRVHERRPA
jgi:hypothetical protein